MTKTLSKTAVGHRRKVDIERWLGTHREECVAFVTYWRGLHQVDPELFPKRMTVSDWDEQYDVFMDQY